MRLAGLRARERPGAGGSSGGESRELWAAPGGSVAAPERSGKAAGSFGRILARFEEVREHTRGEGRLQRGVDFRSLKR